MINLPKIYTLMELDPNCDLHSLVDKYNSNITHALDKHAPEKIIKSNLKERNIWYSDKLVEIKKSLRKRAKIWTKYREEHQWLALKNMQRKYKSLAMRSFSVHGPKIWNSLPNPLRTIESLDQLDSHFH